MITWKLTPKNGKGYVRIRAATEDRAREIAHDRFANTNVNKAIHTVSWNELDWKNPNEVICTREEDDMSKTEGILDIV